MKILNRVAVVTACGLFALGMNNCVVGMDELDGKSKAEIAYSAITEGGKNPFPKIEFMGPAKFPYDSFVRVADAADDELGPADSYKKTGALMGLINHRLGMKKSYKQYVERDSSAKRNFDVETTNSLATLGYYTEGAASMLYLIPVLKSFRAVQTSHTLLSTRKREEILTDKVLESNRLFQLVEFIKILKNGKLEPSKESETELAQLTDQINGDGLLSLLKTLTAGNPAMMDEGYAALGELAIKSYYPRAYSAYLDFD